MHESVFADIGAVLGYARDPFSSRLEAHVWTLRCNRSMFLVKSRCRPAHFGHALEHLLMDQPPWLMQVADDAIRGDPSTVESVCSVG